MTLPPLKIIQAVLETIETCAPEVAPEARMAIRNLGLLESAMNGLLKRTHMRVHHTNRLGWQCPICKVRHESLTELEKGLHHLDDCEYAIAYKAINE